MPNWLGSDARSRGGKIPRPGRLRSKRAQGSDSRENGKLQRPKRAQGSDSRENGKLQRPKDGRREMAERPWRAE